MRYLLCGINAKYIHSNLAVYSLLAYAGEHGPRSAMLEIKEYTINHYVEDILQDLYERKADVLIFSCYIWNISYVREIAAEIKKVAPELAIWVGGPEVSYDAEKFLQENPAVDLVMEGEGEETFCRLVCEMEKSGEECSFESIAGICYRQESAIIDHGFAPIMDLNNVPFVYEDFHLFEHKILYYETSRGCPFCCSYCLSSVDKTVRFRSFSLVEKELKRFLEAKVPQVKFVDRTFNCNKKHAMEIWRYIYEHDNGVTNFHFEISSDLLDEEEMNLFSKMRPGLIQLEIGVQSTNGATVDAIRRHMDLDRLFENVDRVHRMGNIHQHLDLIAGLPEEGYTRFGESFDALYVHEPDQLQLGFLKVLKGTHMEEKIEEYELSYRSCPPYEVLKTRWLTYDEVIRLKGIEDMVETYYNSGQFTYTLRYVMQQMDSPFAFYEKFAGFYKEKGYNKLKSNRMKKYEILREFLESMSVFSENEWKLVSELLILDIYLRENIKTRPSWGADVTSFKKEWIKKEKEIGRQLCHIESFCFDPMLFMQEGKMKQGVYDTIFDYRVRNPLNKEAQISFDVLHYGE